ncbi:hypothetical protein ACSEQ5_29725 [Pseudomonas aeruginosa]
MTISRLPDNVHSIPWQLTVSDRKTITCAESTDDAMSCQRTLSLGFFFDGTRNNGSGIPEWPGTTYIPLPGDDHV